MQSPKSYTTLLFYSSLLLLFFSICHLTMELFTWWSQNLFPPLDKLFPCYSKLASPIELSIVLPKFKINEIIILDTYLWAAGLASSGKEFHSEMTDGKKEEE